MAEERSFLTGLEKPATAPTIIVKGGTTPTSYDNEVRKLEAEAEKRRDELDRDREVCSKPIEAGGGKMYSHFFGHPKDDPKVLVTMVDGTGEPLYKMLCDILIEMLEDKPSMTMIMVCPDCVARGIPQGQAQLRVNDRHRKWYLDDRTKGMPILWEDENGQEMYISAGEIMDSEVIRCSNFNCQFACTIHRGRMRRA